MRSELIVQLLKRLCLTYAGMMNLSALHVRQSISAPHHAAKRKPICVRLIAWDLSGRFVFDLFRLIACRTLIAHLIALCLPQVSNELPMPNAYAFEGIEWSGKSHKIKIFICLLKRIVPKGAHTGGFDVSFASDLPVLRIVYYGL